MTASGCPKPEPSSGHIEVEKARVRATPPGAKHGAAFMVLRNRGPDAKLVAVRSDVSESVELHTHREENGRMRMRRIPQIAIPGRGQVELRPGGLHVMFIDLKAPLRPGDTVRMTLVFDDESERVVAAPVTPISSNASPSSRPGPS